MAIIFQNGFGIGVNPSAGVFPGPIQYNGINRQWWLASGPFGCMPAWDPGFMNFFDWQNYGCDGITDMVTTWNNRTDGSQVPDMYISYADSTNSDQTGYLTDNLLNNSGIIEFAQGSNNVRFDYNTSSFSNSGFNSIYVQFQNLNLISSTGTFNFNGFNNAGSNGNVSGNNFSAQPTNDQLISINFPPVISGGTANGDLSVSNSYNPFGPGSSYLFGGQNGYIALNPSTDWSLGTGDFTVEWFEYPNSLSGWQRMFQIGAYPSTTFGVSIENGTFYLWENGGVSFSFSNAVYPNNWYHFAIVRISGTTTVYRNGQSLGSFSDSHDLGSGSVNMNIGTEEPATSGTYFNGALTNFRWTKGLGIYTGNFLLPTSNLTITSSANPYGGYNTSAIDPGYVKLLLIP